MSVYRTLEVICLKKANQASSGTKIIWALELGKPPDEKDVDIVRDLFSRRKIEDLRGSYSFANLVPSQEDTPGDLNILLNTPHSSSRPNNFKGWKRYFNNLVSFYLSKADEFAQKQVGC